MLSIGTSYIISNIYNPKCLKLFTLILSYISRKFSNTRWSLSMIDQMNNSLIISSLLLLFSIVASKISKKFGLPILVLFLGIGMIAGIDSIGGINFENYELSHSLSLLAICIIIFSGGLLTKSEDIKPIIKSGVSLSTIGVLLTTTFIGLFCYTFIGTPIYESLLIGAVLSSTDAAAVFTAFRDKDSQVRKNVKSVLEFESGSNDPMAFLLVSLFLGFYSKDMSLDSQTVKMVILNPTIGLLGGYIAFKTFKWINDHIVLDFQGLYPAMTMGFVFLTYSSITKLEGNGFLAVYFLAVQIGNTKILHKNLLLAFFDGVSWLSQIGLFILLGLLVTPERLINVAPQGIFLAMFLIFFARPATTFISTIGSKFTNKEKVFISWAGLKGATPIVFAALVATEVGTEANFIFDIIFFSVLVSALLQGTTLNFVAKKCDLLFEAIYDPEFPIDIETIEKTKNGIKEIKINEGDFAINQRIIDLNLPKGTLVLFIKRTSGFIIPDGSTSFEKDDKVLIVTPEKQQIFDSIVHFRNDINSDEVLSNVLDDVPFYNENKDVA